MTQPVSDPSPDRRGFLKRAATILAGLVGMLPPLGAGLAVLLDPLRRTGAATRSVKVATLAALPADGKPRKFPVVMSRVDAWTRTPATPVGAVYLRRTGEKEVYALNVVCPHAGCFVEYKEGSNDYSCPCHNSTFAIDGAIQSRESPSPRALDTLEVEVRGEGEVWVKFQNFRAGTAEKIPLG